MQRLKRTSNPRNGLDTFLQKLAGTEDTMSPTQKKQLMSCLFNNMIAFALIVFSGVTAYYASKSKSTKPSKYLMYMFFIVLPVIAGIGMSINLFSAASKPTTILFVIVTIILMILVSVYFLAYNTQSQFVSQVLKYVSILFTLGILAVGYRAIVRYLKNIPGWLGFIIKLLFYIPCLVLDFFELMYIKTLGIVYPAGLSAAALAKDGWVSAKDGAVMSTDALAAKVGSLHGSKYDGVVFFSILGVLGGGVALYYLLPYLRKHNLRSLVERPMTLSKQTTIMTNDVMRVPTSYPDRNIINPALYSNSPDSAYNHNYSIEAWVNINTAMKGQPILCYGRLGELKGKPAIITSSETTNKPFSLVFTNNYTTLDDAVFDFDMPLQKWNYLVITYDDNRVDMYLNAELVFSRAITAKSAKIPNYDTDDVIYVGSSTAKIYGSITHVNYHKKPMSLRDVTTTYATVKHTL